ncbi:hypothetical protein KBW71_11555 [Hydrogenophaga aromaticivorans]|uniref:DUF5658 family protein n=1 Tax=Hydrogenophaga aromaticivorans TaxID=2610898 RepID=UPI001B38998B|nr:DUF5658 family protein [Hydrogenophaga aromaticivorans]MBQ0919073.1 hypothetical protein [Hydrogenophaga aromaticivorans]
MNALPLIPTELFFALMVALQIVDAWSTYTALKSGQAKEANGPLRALMKAVGVKEALWIVKLGYLALLWVYPPTGALPQWLALGLYVGIAINNLRVLRKIKKASA